MKKYNPLEFNNLTEEIAEALECCDSIHFDEIAPEASYNRFIYFDQATSFVDEYGILDAIEEILDHGWDLNALGGRSYCDIANTLYYIKVDDLLYTHFSQYDTGEELQKEDIKKLITELRTQKRTTKQARA